MPRIGKKTKIRNWTRQRGWRRIGEPEWEELCQVFPGVTPEDLEALEIPVDAPWCGVRGHEAEEVESSLRALSEVYAAREDLRRFCRVAVIRAKERARWAARNPRVEEAKQRLKAELVEWMLVWLGDPAMFPAWVAIRRGKMTGAP